jgi:EAL domain-containing protein (putative c-di-GMP-specific phosphodiesterase class I)
MNDGANRLLAVDDQPDILDFISQVAESAGWQVALAESAVQFRELLSAFTPTLILLDLQMPGCDGIELLRDLAKGQVKAPVLISSGMDARVLASAEQLGRAQGLTMAGILPKPLLLADLEAVLAQHHTAPRMPQAADLARAIEARQIAVHYQPLCRLVAGAWRPCAVEALARWQHSEFGFIPPDRFIPLAEETGLIAGLTDQVLREGVRQLAEWRAGGLDLGLSVNLSPRLVRDLDFPDRLEQLVGVAGVPPRRVTLEITETAALNEPARTRDILTRMRLKGFGLALDDFGTGWSSLTQLYQMPFNELKIDKSLGLELHHSPEARTIVRSLVDLAHNLRLEVCTEGIETEAALEFLAGIRCDVAQGYFLGRPAPAQLLEAQLRPAATVRPVPLAREPEALRA